MTIPNLTLEQRTAFAELLASKDQEVLKEMLSLVHDAAIRRSSTGTSAPNRTSVAANAVTSATAAGRVS